MATDTLTEKFMEFCQAALPDLMLYQRRLTTQHDAFMAGCAAAGVMREGTDEQATNPEVLSPDEGARS